MHIAIDARPLQLDAYKERGIGVHLRSWIEAAQHLDVKEQFSLLIDPTLPRPRLQLTSARWRFQPLDLPFGPLSNSAALQIDKDEEFLFDSALESYLLQHQVDVFHETYPFMWETFVARRLYNVKWAVMIYDLIPLRFKDHYLTNLGGRGRESYAQRLGGVVYAQRVQTLSAASMKDIVEFTGISPAKLDVVYGGVDESFDLLPDERIKSDISNLGVTPPYIFSVSGLHHAKNLRRLLEAYSGLPVTLRRTYQLVIRCPLDSNKKPIVDKWLREFRIENRVVFLRELSKEQLVSLYNGASLVVHATLYEGLGLPVLEAMRCGTPVVASNVASLPEIAGDAAMLVNPYSSSSIAKGITRVLGSPNIQDAMRERGLYRARSYTWERTANAILSSLKKAAKADQYNMKRVFPISWNIFRKRRLRLAFWSPINPCRSGISDYSEQLLVELSKLADVDIFVDGYQGTNTPFFDSFPTFDGRAYPYLAQHRSYDMSIYQVGNNPLHRYMYNPLFKWPGVVTLHDIYIYHFVHAAIMLEGRVDEFWDEVAFCEGSSVAQKARVDYLKGVLDDYTLALNKRIVLRSRGVIVHSSWAQRQINQYEEAPPVRTIPMGLLDLPDDGGRFGRIVRRLLGLPEDGFVFGVFGNIHRVKRITTILNAFARVRKQYPTAILFIMGKADISVSDVIASLQDDPSSSRHRGIHLHLGYVPYDFMLMSMQAVDVGLNLRYPTVGETSASLSNLLGQRKPTIVSDIGSYAEYPDKCCPKVPVDSREEDVLVKWMRKFIEDDNYYRRAVSAVDNFVSGRTWAACAEQYLEFVTSLL
ncbi:MAG: glycosyltransferase [Anaerolineae bacterium]